MTRPLCPACHGTRVMGDKHPRPCTCCEDGHMRGIDDPTPEERRIAELTERLRAARKAFRNIRRLLKFSHDYMRPIPGYERSEDAVDMALEIARAESDRLGGGA